MTEIKAQLNGLRIAPRKVRSLTNLIKGKNVDDAIDQLRHFVRRGSPALVKLVESAVANAKNNFKLERDVLTIKSMLVDEGIKLKRYRPKGFGRAAPIEKKTSRIRVILEAKETAKPEKKTKKAVKEDKKTE
jgi:large subunit ribosomal protein L22